MSRLYEFPQKRVLRFNRQPVRRWEIVQRPNGYWRGELYEGELRVGRTDEGQLHVVRSTLEGQGTGLPIIVRQPGSVRL